MISYIFMGFLLTCTNNIVCFPINKTLIVCQLTSCMVCVVSTSHLVSHYIPQHIIYIMKVTVFQQTIEIYSTLLNIYKYAKRFSVL